MWSVGVCFTYTLAVFYCYFCSTASSTACAESGRCCPDGISLANDSFLTGCPPQSLSVDCATYVRLVGEVAAAQSTTCTTTTDCLALKCVYEHKRASFFFPSLTIEWILDSGCLEAISGLLRVKVPTESFTWTHKFVGNSSALVEGLRWRWNGAIAADMYVKTQLFRVGRSVSFGVWLQSAVPVTANSAYLLWSREYIPQRLLPANVSLCEVNDTTIDTLACSGCKDSCIQSLYGYNRGVCYKCPNEDCFPTSSHSVCGSDGNTYSSECLLRKEACRLRQEIRVEYPGGCTDLHLTPVKVVTSWPSSYDNLTQETISFIKYAVVYIQVESLNKIMALYNKTNLKSKLSQITGYDIDVPHITSDGNNRINLTLYGLYHSSEGWVVPGYQLRETVRRSGDSILRALSGQIIAGDRPWGSSCTHKQRRFSSPQCLDFMQRARGLKENSRSSCTTATDCHRVDCLFKFRKISSEMTATFHKCAYPVSVDIRFMIHQLGFNWQGRFTGNASVVVPGLNVTDAGSTVQIRLLFKLFSVNGNIYFSATTDPILTAESSDVNQQLVSTFHREVLPLGVVPLDTAECNNPPSRGCCPDCNSGCLWGALGGTHCYVCPHATCQTLTSRFPVCGMDGVTYDNECSLRKTACQLGRQIRLDYSGQCRDVRPTFDNYPITQWPARVEDFPPEYQAFVGASVLFAAVDVPEFRISSYTQFFFETKFREAVGYRVFVPVIYVVGDGRSKRHSGEIVHMNVTIYAQYWSSENTTVPSVELLDAFNSMETALEVAIDADIVSIRQSYASEMREPVDQDDSMSSGVVAAIVIASLVAVVAIVVTIVAVIWWNRKTDKAIVKASNGPGFGETKQDDVLYLTKRDEVAVVNSVFTGEDGSQNDS